MKALSRFLKDESGATAIEYGLIAGAITILVVTLVPLFGPALTGLFTGIGTALGGATPN